VPGRTSAGREQDGVVDFERRALARALGLRKGPACPACGSADTRPIVFGLPGERLFRAAELGLVELGGCCLDDAAPDFRCGACGAGGWRDGRYVPGGE